MYLVVGLLSIFLGSFANAENKKDLVDAYFSDAKVSASTGDLYRSFKLYTYLYKNNRKEFNQRGIEDYIYVVSQIGSKDRLKKVCNVLGKNVMYRSRVSYKCAMEFYKAGDIAEAKKYIKKINSKSKIYAMSNLLHASISLAEEDYKQCLKVLAENESKKYRNQGLEDLYYLTRARCLASSEKYKEAIVAYQGVRSGSRYYFESLLEISWTYFKLRDVEGVKSSSKAILATYDSNRVSDKSLGANAYEYFQVKYLISYLPLVVYGVEKEKLFNSLNEELNSYLSKDFIKIKGVKDFYKEIISSNSISDLKIKSNVYGNFIYHISQWIPYSELVVLNNLITNHIALKKELGRIKTLNLKLNKYVTAVEKIERINTGKLKVHISKMYDSASRSLYGHILKNKIGAIDFENLTLTSGLKSIEEATASYKVRQGNIKDKMGNVYD